MYRAKCWALSRTNEKSSDVFERKIFCRMCGLIEDAGQWRSRYNNELYNLFKETKLSIIMKIVTL